MLIEETALENLLRTALNAEWVILGEDAEKEMFSALKRKIVTPADNLYDNIIEAVIHCEAKIPIRHSADPETILGYLSMKNIESSESNFIGNFPDTFDNIIYLSYSSDDADIWLQYVVMNEFKF